jgi:uncharacterized protein YdcH (DUF465 family)
MSNLNAETALKEFLITNDETFRALATEHHDYETRLSELSSLHFPNEDEQVEEATIKKKKLHLKDQMEAIMTRAKTSQMSH